jgi:hypothetical protein
MYARWAPFAGIARMRGLASAEAARIAAATRRIAGRAGRILGMAGAGAPAEEAAMESPLARVCAPAPGTVHVTVLSPVCELHPWLRPLTHLGSALEQAPPTGSPADVGST